MNFHHFGICYVYLLYISPVCLGAFAKLRKLTGSFVMSVCLSVRPHWTSWFPVVGFSLTFYLFLEYLSRKFKFY